MLMDITMCEGYDCPKKERCFRFYALPDPHRQSYFAEDPRDIKGNCWYFWDELEDVE